MQKGNTILEQDLEFVLETTSPEEILNFLGVPGLSFEQLLDLIEIGAKASLKIVQNYDPKDLKDYHSIGKKYAPIAFAIFMHLFQKDEQPRLPVWKVANRFEACGCSPNTIIFWSDPDLIVGLYESLKKDGYYAGTDWT